MPSYSDIVKQTDWNDAPVRADIPEEWAQGRTIFGGLTAGLALRSLLPQIEAGRPLRSALISFVGPVRAGDVTISTQILRAGRNVTHAQANLVQGDDCCCTVLVCFGKERDTPVHIAPPSMPDLPPPDALTITPFVPGVSPEFTRYVEYSWTEDSIPYMGNGSGSSDGWIRLREESAITPDLFLLLTDAWPSPALAMLQGLAPISSLTWSLEVFELNPTHRADDWWNIRACIDSAAEGYVHEDALIWGPDGSPAARSRQTVSVYLPTHQR